MLEIENDGPRIVATNYWQTELASRGLVYLSVNAGAFRLLLPRQFEAAVEEMRTAEYAIVTQGTWYPEQSYPRRDAFEVLFEDQSDMPYSIHVGPEQVDRLPASAANGRTDLTLLVYTQGPTLRATLPARYRRKPRLPYLKPWGK